MSFVENQGAKIYWDEEGSGEPLLLVMGLSAIHLTCGIARDPFLQNDFAPLLWTIVALGKVTLLPAFIPSH